MPLKKLLFFGTPDIATPTLEALAEAENIEVLAVCVFPDRKVGRKQILIPCPVKASAEKLGLSIEEIGSKDDLVNVIKKYDFDLGIVIAFGMIFPGEVLESGKFVNVHFSLLPQYRGASPVQSAILNSDKVSGITFQLMEKELDAGDILFQKEFPIEGKSTSNVFQAFAEFTAELLPEFLEQDWNSHPQNNDDATFCTKFKKSDGEIFPVKETAKVIYQKFLAFDLFPGIYKATNKGNVKLTDVSLEPSEHSYELHCDKNTILFVDEAQVPGKIPMPIQEILRGAPGLFGKM
jgi:methionyl-tRNA formyltransferase